MWISIYSELVHNRHALFLKAATPFHFYNSHTHVRHFGFASIDFHGVSIEIKNWIKL